MMFSLSAGPGVQMHNAGLIRPRTENRRYVVNSPARLEGAEIDGGIIMGHRQAREFRKGRREARKALWRRLSRGSRRPGQRKCRVCGCTNLRACEGECFWVERDLCSRCAPAKRVVDYLSDVIEGSGADQAGAMGINEPADFEDCDFEPEGV